MYLKRVLMVVLGCALAGCSIFGGDDAYKKSTETAPLDVPPGLAKPAQDSRMAIPPKGGDKQRADAAAKRQRQPASSRAKADSDTVKVAAQPATPANQVLPKSADVHLRREGNLRWLEIDAAPAALWPQLRAFWRQAGVKLVRDEPRLGIMQTDWIKPSKDLSGSGARTSDSFHLRLEREDADSTNLYVADRERVRNADAGKSRRAPSKPAREAELLTRLMVYLGEPRQQAKRQLAAAKGEETDVKLDKVAGIPVLVVKDPFPRVWRLMGVALDRAGLPVQDEDPLKGVYYFHYEPAPGEAKGHFAGLFVNKKAKATTHERYQIHLLDQPGQILITAQSAAHKALPPAAAQEILERLIDSMQRGDGASA